MSSILKSVSAGSLAKCQSSRTSRQEDSIIDILDSSTGFGENRVLHNVTSCKKPTFKTPLYQENYLGEFKTEEEKAAARRALGLFNKGDVVAMSLLTTKEELPNIQNLIVAPIKQMNQGDKLFVPVTTFAAVYDKSGVTLEKKFKEVQDLVTKTSKEILNITQVSNKATITTLGDVQMFLKGFNNGDTLQDTLDSMNQENLRFEVTGEINS